MEGKMTKIEKIMAICSLLILITAIIVRGVIGVNDSGVFVILSFTGLLMWLIFLICAFFPSDWRMTEKQKAKIMNRVEYQNKYRRTLIIIDTILAVIFAVMIMTLG